MSKRFDPMDLEGARNRVIEAAQEIEVDWEADEPINMGRLLDGLFWLRFVESNVESSRRLKTLRVEDLQATTYALPNEATIEWRGGNAWTIVRFGEVLNKDGNWEYEPRTSNREDDFIERTRYKSAQEALDRWNSLGETP